MLHNQKNKLDRTGPKYEKDQLVASPDLVQQIKDLNRRQAALEKKEEELQQALLEMRDQRDQYADLYEFAPFAYLNLDEKQQITQINLAGTMLLHDIRTRILQSPFILYLNQEGQKSFLLCLEHAARTKEMQSLDLQLAGVRGKGGWVHVKIKPDFAADGSLSGYLMSMVDFSAGKKAEDILFEREKKYRLLFEEMANGVMLLEWPGSGMIEFTEMRSIEVNNTFARLTGISRERARGTFLAELWPRSVSILWQSAASRAMRTEKPVEVEHFNPELGKQLHVTFFSITNRRIGVAAWDVSELRQGREKMRQACRDLEIVLGERSGELLETNRRLGEETMTHRLAKQQLAKSEEELQISIVQLDETKAALQVMLKGRDEERAQLEEKVVCNLNELVRPLLLKLAEGKLNSRQQDLLQSINNSLDGISSPISRRFILESNRLTPVETRVAELIRQGKTSKDIALTLGVAVSTIDYHRLNIRKRLGLRNKAINLQSYLATLL